MEKEKRPISVRRVAVGFAISVSLLLGGYSFHAKSELEQRINDTNNSKIAEELQGERTRYEALTGLSIASAAGAASLGFNPRKRNNS